MKRPKTVESKNEEQLKPIEYQREKQLKGIKDQNKNQLKAILQSKSPNISILKNIKRHDYAITEEREKASKRLLNLENGVNYQIDCMCQAIQ